VERGQRYSLSNFAAWVWYRGSAMIERPEASALFVRLRCFSNVSGKSQEQLPWCNPRKEEKGWHSGDIQAGSDQRMAMPWSMVKPSLHMTSFAERRRILLAPVLNQDLTPASTTSCRHSSARHTSPACLCSVFNRGRLKDCGFSVEAGAGDPGADQRSRHLLLSIIDQLHCSSNQNDTLRSTCI
jgi:hypothetical protein